MMFMAYRENGRIDAEWEFASHFSKLDAVSFETRQSPCCLSAEVYLTLASDAGETIKIQYPPAVKQLHGRGNKWQRRTQNQA